MISIIESSTIWILLAVFAVVQADDSGSPANVCFYSGNEDTGYQRKEPNNETAALLKCLELYTANVSVIYASEDDVRVYVDDISGVNDNTLDVMICMEDADIDGNKWSLESAANMVLDHPNSGLMSRHKCLRDTDYEIQYSTGREGERDSLSRRSILDIISIALNLWQGWYLSRDQCKTQEIPNSGSIGNKLPVMNQLH